MSSESTPHAEATQPENMPATQDTLRGLLALITEKAGDHLPDVSITKPLALERPEDGQLGVARILSDVADPTRVAQIQRKAWLDESHTNVRTANYFIHETADGLSMTLANNRLEIDGRSMPDEHNPAQNLPVSEATARQLLQMIQDAK